MIDLAELEKKSTNFKGIYRMKRSILDKSR